jgi:hypothetical protein
MANLRANNLTGTGGRNAIDGSVYFGNYTNSINDYLELADHEDFEFGSGDYTVEFWCRPTRNGSVEEIVNKGYPFQIFRNSQSFDFAVDSNTSSYDINTSFGSGVAGEWYHIAVARSGSTTKCFLNGVEGLSSTSNTSVYDSSSKFSIGRYSDASTYKYQGYVSNLRVVKGTALYTASFTPPTEKLTAVDGTVLLCCQDSDNSLQEATGKTITGYGIHPSEAYDANGEGPELVTSTGVWTLACGGSSCSNFTVTKSGQKLSATTVSSGYVRATYSGLNPGSKYRVKVTLVAGSNNNFAVQGLSADTGYVPSTDGTAGSALQVGPSYVFEWSGASEVQLTGSAWNTLYTFDDVSIKQIPNDDIPKVLPSVGVDEGVVFDGNTKVNTQSYMYFPTGDTSQRGRGRGLFGGGYSPQNINVIQYLEIQSMGNTMDFGDLQDMRRGVGGCASQTRGIFAGGVGPNNTGSTKLNTIGYVTISNTGNAINFGDLLNATRNVDGCSNSTRGVFFGDQTPTFLNTIQYVTIATTGNATDFGDASTGGTDATAIASSTRAIWAGGFRTPDSAAVNTIEYVTIATTGNSSDFGDLLGLYGQSASAASSTRGIIFNGSIGPTPSNNSNVIQYVTIASTGNATDFGDNTGGAWENARGVTNSLRGVFAGGYQPAWGNAITYITMATTGDSSDFGDLLVTGGGSGCSQAGNASDSHGGLG